MFLIYNSKPRSYRELPLRLSEFGKVHRHELSGVLHGLLRVRAFTQDDVHIFCTLDQIKSEILRVLKLIRITLKETGFETITISLATKPEKAMGSDADWDKSIQALKDALEDFGVDFNIKEGEGAFYGPKIEIGIKDSLGREWQCGTIQVDFAQPENFDMTYVASSGKKERPVVIHHAIYGSLERFFAIALEHHKGKLPFWMAPEQIRILPVTDEHIAYAKAVKDKLRDQGIRVTVDESSDPLQGKIKLAQKDLIPWMFIVGDDEVENNTVTLRYNSGKQEKQLSMEDITAKIQAALPQTQ
jgi:threonyl-tRNA synthetase